MALTARTPPVLQIAEPPSDGFRAELPRAALSDLIQLQCLSGGSGAFEVTSRGRRGRLYFREGQLIAAVAPGQTGRDAALTLLSWREGTFVAIQGQAPVSAPITESWQSLLMSAACRDDEARRSSPPSEPPAAIPQEEELLELDELVFFEDVGGAVAESSRLMRIEGVTSVVQNLEFNLEGALLSGGAEHRELGEVLAFTAELAALLGDGLGLDRLQGAEFSGPTGTLLLRADKEKLSVCLLGTTEDASPHRARFGL